MELMVVVAIIFIIAVFTVPSFAGLMEKSRVSATADQLYGDLQFAKTESLRRSSQVAVIKQSGTSTEPWAKKGWCVASTFLNAQACNGLTATNILLNKVGSEATVDIFTCTKMTPEVKINQLVFWNGYAFEQNAIFDTIPVTDAHRATVPAIVPPRNIGVRITSGSGSSFAERWLLITSSSVLVANPTSTEIADCPSP